MSEQSGQSVDPDEAFSLVASETRFGVLQALWDLTTGTSESSVSFADLHDASESAIRGSSITISTSSPRSSFEKPTESIS